MKTLVICIGFIFLLIPEEVYGNQCFSRERVILPDTSIREGNKLLHYQKTRLKLPRPNRSSPQECLGDMVEFVANQRSVNYLKNQINKLLNERLDELTVLNHINQLSKHLDVSYSQQRFFVYAMVRVLGFEASLTYNRNEKSKDNVVWIALSRPLKGLPSIVFHGDSSTHYYAVYKRQISDWAFNNATRIESTKLKKVLLAHNSLCFSNQMIKLKKARVDILGVKSSYHERKIRIPTTFDNTTVSCQKELISFVQSQQAFKALISEIRMNAANKFNVWRYMLEAQAIAENVSGSQLQRRFLLFVLYQSLGVDSAFTYHKEHDKNGSVWVNIKQKVQKKYLQLSGRRYYALHSDNSFPSGPSLYLIQGRSSHSQVDLLGGALAYIHSVSSIIQTRTIRFNNHRGLNDSATLRYNLRLNQYWASLPKFYVLHQKNTADFFLIDDVLTKSIKDAFGARSMCSEKDIHCHKNQLERAQAFTMSGFNYKTDQDAYGVELHLPFYKLLQENYPYSDCDDRAIAFTTIANVLGYDAVLIDLPQHLASGIKLEFDIKGAKKFKGYYYVEATSSTKTAFAKLGYYPFNDREITRLLYL